VNAVDHLIQEGTLWIEGEVEDPIHQHLMEGNLEQIREEILYLADITNELSAQHAALLEVVKGLKRQRDMVIDQGVKEVAALIARSFGVSVDRADMLLTVLCNPEMDLLEVDFMTSDTLSHYRDEIQHLIDAMEWDVGVE
jgi:hypothetical protein